MGFPGGSDSKESDYNAGDLGSIPRSGIFTRDWNGYPVQYSCLENSMYRGLWWATVYGVTNLTLIVFHINHSMFLQQHFKCHKQDIAYIIVEGGFLLRRFMETGIKTITKKKKCKKQNGSLRRPYK